MAILFEQVTPLKGHELKVSDENLFVARMMAAFQQLPCQLDKTHIERLQGMKAATLGEYVQNPFDEMILAIKRYGAIKVWVRYESAKNSD